jgi:hypothetical protein
MAEAPDTAADAIAALGASPTADDVYHATIDFSAREIAAAAVSGGGGGGGGGVGVESVHVTIPHAQILTLKTTPVTLVAATEVLNYDGVPATIPWPVACTVIGVSGGGAPYVLAGEFPALYIYLSTEWDMPVAVSSRVLFQEIDGLPLFSHEPAVFLPKAGQFGFAAQFDLFSEALNADLTGVLNDNGLSLLLGAKTGSANPTGGDASNRLEVYLSYVVLTL